MFPTRFVAGDTVVFPVESRLVDGQIIAPPAWTLTYRLRGNGKRADVVGGISGSGWIVIIPAATTNTFPAGTFAWSADVSHADGRRYTLAAGTIDVLTNVATAGENHDGRTQSQKDLDAIDAAIRARIAGGMVAEYAIGSRNLRYESLAALRQLRSEIATRVANEKSAAAIADGLGSRKRIGVRFI